ncbi:TfoX/Sxy family protein [Sagittula sp. SSi028]|uniref:TfoX/Sxy family protein n=1 Tax=Sagittula sp. SSi028 TaxID=3400636 RepID=UPI003AF96CEE
MGGGTPISTIRNLGPAMEASMNDAGIPDAETLRSLGADAAYRKLLDHGQRPHFISYYVLHMALQGRPWNDCKGAEKDRLRESFDALKAQTAPSTDEQRLFDRLSEIGVIPRDMKR